MDKDEKVWEDHCLSKGTFVSIGLLLVGCTSYKENCTSVSICRLSAPSMERTCFPANVSCHANSFDR